MTDRLTNIIVGLQRLGEEARIKGEDIRYSQRHEDAEHLKYLRDLRAMVQRVLNGIVDEERKFLPPADEPEHERLHHVSEPGAIPPKEDRPMPKFLQQGPRKEAS